MGRSAWLHIGRWLLWCVFAVSWTVGLLAPSAHALADPFVSPEAHFLVAKLTHVTGYAFFAVLTALLWRQGRMRWYALAFLSFHAFATEFGQRFIPTRTGSLRDVGLDHLGICIGCLLTLQCWRSPRPVAARLPVPTATTRPEPGRP